MESECEAAVVESAGVCCCGAVCMCPTAHCVSRPRYTFEFCTYSTISNMQASDSEG